MKVIVTRTNKRILTMRLDQDGVLQVVANSKLPLQKVKEMVELERHWINEQIKINNSKNSAHSVGALQRETCAGVAAASSKSGSRAKGTTRQANYTRSHAQRNKPDAEPVLTPTQYGYYGEMFSGKKCLLCGKLHKIMPTSENKCHLDDNCIYIPQKLYYDKTTRLKTLKNYLKKLSEQHISSQISKFGSNASLCPTKIEFKCLPADQWVKCTNPKERAITLDYRICQLPPNLQHYLIAHAFAHFSYTNHSQEFWHTVGKHVSRYKDCANQLAEYDFLKDVTSL